MSNNLDSEMPEFLKKIDTIEVPHRSLLAKLKSLRTVNWAIYRGNYKWVLEYLKYIQLALGVCGFVTFTLAPGGLSKIYNEGLSAKKFLPLGFEIFLWWGLTYLIGKDEIPVNYVALLLQRCFVHLDSKFLTNIQQKPVPAVFQLFSTQSEKLGFKNFDIVVYFALTSSAVITITSITAINISHCDTLCLLGTVLATTWTTVILLSAMAIEYVGIENHLVMCEYWIYFSAATTLFLMIYTMQRLFKRLRYKYNKVNKPKAILEMFLFALSLRMGIEYIPAIHQDFSFKQLLSHDAIVDRFTNLLPTEIRDVYHRLHFCGCSWLYIREPTS